MHAIVKKKVLIKNKIKKKRKKSDKLIVIHFFSKGKQKNLKIIFFFL